MGSSDRYVVVMDFMGIKPYIFGTYRLVEIAGASALLTEFNLETIPDILEQRFKPNYRCVFVGGGLGQFIIEDSPENIKDAFRACQGMVREKCGRELHLASGMALLTGDYRVSLDKAFLDLEKKDLQGRIEPFHSIHSGFIRECESCSGLAREVTRYGEEKHCLCSFCVEKENKGRAENRGLWSRFTEFLEGKGIERREAWRRRSVDFDEIGIGCRARSGYTALVYADGNGMGRLVSEINNIERFSRFAYAVDNSLQEACHEALWEHCPMKSDIIPADILMLGGDDLIVYLAADIALPFATRLARLFEEKTRRKLIENNPDDFFKNLLNGNGLTISMGIAYGKSHTPISIMLSQGEELLKTAKKKGRTISGESLNITSCLDFHLTSRFNHVKVSDSRKQHLTYQTSRREEVRLYGGPYTLDEAEDLLGFSRSLKASGIPNSRLHRLGEAPFKGKIGGTIETLIAYGRCDSSQQKAKIRKALEKFNCMAPSYKINGTPPMPWRIISDDTMDYPETDPFKEKKEKTIGALGTVLVDLVEITALTERKREDQGDET